MPSEDEHQVEIRQLQAQVASIRAANAAKTSGSQWTRMMLQAEQDLIVTQEMLDQQRLQLQASLAEQAVLRQKIAVYERTCVETRKHLVDATHGGEEGIPEGATLPQIANTLRATVVLYRKLIDRLNVELDAAPRTNWGLGEIHRTIDLALTAAENLLGENDVHPDSGLVSAWAQCAEAMIALKRLEHDLERER